MDNCSCCYGLGVIDADTHHVCTDPTAHNQQPRLELAGIVAYECPHCQPAAEPTAIRPATGPDQVAAITMLARQVATPIYDRRGIHRGVLRQLRATFAFEHAIKETPDA